MCSSIVVPTSRTVAVVVLVLLNSLAVSSNKTLIDYPGKAPRNSNHCTTLLACGRPLHAFRLLGTDNTTVSPLAAGEDVLYACNTLAAEQTIWIQFLSIVSKSLLH